jgi:hypothetical protein
MNESAFDLEVKAAEERRRLHSSVAELRSSIREAVDLKKNTRQHLGAACGVAILVGLTMGYFFAGILTGEGRKVKWPY